MEVTKLAMVNGVAADIIDSRGRFIYAPDPLTLQGHQNIPADLQPGETLQAFLCRHVPGVESGGWSVSISGTDIPQSMWKYTRPKDGQLIACRAIVGRQVVQLVALAVLTYFTFGLGTATAGMAGAGFVAAGAGKLAALGVYMAGSILINKVLAPKLPSISSGAAKQVYSLSGQSNSARAYGALPTLWGEMRVTPDLASKPYTWFEGDDQYLSTILLGGINVDSASDLSIGDTPIESYSDVTTYYNGFPGMASQDVPLYSDADSLPGGTLAWEGDDPWTTRTSSPDTVLLQVDIEGRLYDVGGKRGMGDNDTTFVFEYRKVGTSTWLPWVTHFVSNDKTDTLRYTWSLGVAVGQYEVRGKVTQPKYTDEGDVCEFNWTTLKSIQPDSTNYSGWGRIGIKIRATGQLSGGLDNLRATYRAKPMPIWNGTGWVTATTRANGLSNPGAILLQTLRGIYHGGILQFGYGFQDDHIDIEGLKSFMLHCTARGYTYDKWITEDISLENFCREVALAGMGEFTWTDGSRPTAVFVSSGQPVSGVVTMANMLKGSFSVDYSLSNAADGIEYQYVDRDRNWETNTIRVLAPGVTTSLNPANVTGEGVTTEAQAAVMARYHLAQTIYQYKTINFGTDIEHLDYRRLSVLSVTHDLTQWGYGGRVLRAEIVNGVVELELDAAVPTLATPYIGLRIPGDRDYRVFSVEAFEGETDIVRLVGGWPSGVPFPGEDLDNPAHDTIWCYDFKATPGYRVRVVSMEPDGDLRGAEVSCVPEGPEFWNYVLNGTYAPAPNQSSLPQLGRPTVKNLRISEQVNVQGDTEWYELHAIWDAEGDYDHAQVWAGRDGSELKLVDGNAIGSRTTFRIDAAGAWLVEVRPFNASGLVGQSATVLYITSMTQLPPRNVDDFVVQVVAGGLRRFAWSYTGDRPPAFAGVQIRYLPDDVQLSVADWEDMQPLGEADDVYRAQFETTQPQAGLWTFGCRAIDTAGQLSNGVVRFVASLGDSFEQVQQPDFTPPPAPTGLAAEGLFATVQVQWDTPDYTMGHGHARTEVWAGATADRAQALKVAEGYAGPVSFEWELGSQVYVWARHVTQDGISGEWAGPVLAETAQDVDRLLDVLEGQITSSELHQALVTRIDLIDGPAELAGSVAQQVAAEAAARAAADAAEAQARVDAVAAESQARDDQIAIETHQRMNQVRQASEAALNAVLAANNERIDRIDDVASVRQELTTDFAAGISAEASARLALTTVVNKNVADIASEQTARSTADAALASDITTLTTQVSDNAAAIQSEATARASADSAEATQRDLLATQFRGNYTGDNLAEVTQGLLYQERVTRSAQDQALAQQITLLSAGAGEQFDWKAIWYFDDGVEGWTGNGTPTISQGWLRPANQASDAYVVSPSGIAADGNQYGQARLRIRKVGAPVFAGFLWWSTAAEPAWDASRRVVLAAPTFDANGIGLITVSPTWMATIDRLRVDLSSAQTAADYFEVDWVAIGRPSPGASSAQLLEEQTARADADTAEAAERKTLSSALLGADSPGGLTLEDLTAGLLHEERQARATQDAAIASNLSTLQTTVTSNFSTLESAITAEEQARTTADATEATARKSLSSTLTGFEDPEGKTLADLSSGLVFQEQAARANADSALSESISGLSSTVGDLSADILTVQQTVADLDSATASSVTSLVATDRKNSKAADKLAQAALHDAIAIHKEQASRKETVAFARQELTTKIEEGNLAEAQARLLLAATVDQNTAAITDEQTARATEDEALSQSIAMLAATVDQNTAAITNEYTVRATEDEALAQSIATLTAKVTTDGEELYAAITDEQTARVTADAAEAATRSQLATRVDGVESSLQAQITEEQQTRTTALESEASQRQTLSATVTSNHTAALTAAEDAATAAAAAQGTANAATVAIAAEQSVRANADGHLGAQYTVRMQLGQGGEMVAGGFGLSGTSSATAGTTINFGILANSFWVAAPNGSGVTRVRPFSVQTTSQSINGVIVPAGVYMDAAYINNVTALFGRFGTLMTDKIQTTAINASQLTAGNGVIGGRLRSANYVEGQAGWAMYPSGWCDFHGVTVRGHILATTGTIGTLTINANGLNSGGYSYYGWPAGNATGVHLSHRGLLLGNPSVGRYIEISEAGNISAPGFNVWDGKLTISQIDVIDTLSIRNFAVSNYVTASVGSQGNGWYQDIGLGTLPGGCRVVVTLHASAGVNPDGSNWAWLSAGVNQTGEAAGGAGSPLSFFWPRVSAHTNVPVTGAAVSLSGTVALQGPAYDTPGSFLRIHQPAGSVSPGITAVIIIYKR